MILFKRGRLQLWCNLRPSWWGLSISRMETMTLVEFGPLWTVWWHY